MVSPNEMTPAAGSPPEKPDSGSAAAGKAESTPAEAPKPNPPTESEEKSVRQFRLSSSPHLRDQESVQRIMITVTLTLVPAMLGAAWVFGMRALLLTLIGGAAAVLSEWGIQKFFRMKSTISDGSALLTGVLVSFNLPPGVPWWIPVIGSFFAIAIVKLPFGGLGWNPLNPALAGRAFLLASWPLHMTRDWLPAFWWKQSGYSFFTWNVNPASLMVDGVSTATPLEVAKNALKVLRDGDSYPTDIFTAAANKFTELGAQTIDLAVGTVGGCIGETSAILLLIGAAYLFYKNYIDWRTPFSFIAVVGIGGWMFGGADGFFSGDALFHIFAGGLILGAFYMATDMVTTPITKRGRLIFGVGCGLITLMIRMIGGYPEGVSYAILLMNLTTPLIDRWTIPRRFGHTASTANAKA